jgi:hypothetical protein
MPRIIVGLCAISKPLGLHLIEKHRELGVMGRIWLPKSRVEQLRRIARHKWSQLASGVVCLASIGTIANTCNNLILKGQSEKSETRGTRAHRGSEQTEFVPQDRLTNIKNSPSEIGPIEAIYLNEQSLLVGATIRAVEAFYDPNAAYVVLKSPNSGEVPSAGYGQEGILRVYQSEIARRARIAQIAQRTGNLAALERMPFYKKSSSARRRARIAS